jgi:hypothetical protein
MKVNPQKQVHMNKSRQDKRERANVENMQERVKRFMVKEAKKAKRFMGKDLVSTIEKAEVNVKNMQEKVNVENMQVKAKKLAPGFP